MIKRRQLLGGLAAGMGMALGGRAARAGAPPPGTFTASDVHVQDYPTVQAIQWIGERLAKETDGRLSMRVYHSGQIGRENDTIDLTRYGALDFTRVNFAALTNIFPVSGVLTLPYVFDDVAHMRRALDGAVGRDLLAALSRRGLVAACFYDSGARCIYNGRRPVHEPRDLHGMKIRVPLSDIFMSMAQAMGANPTPLSFGEVFTALQTHLIDGAENNWPSLDSTRQFEVAHYWAETHHSMSPELLFISERSLQALTKADRDLVLDLATRSVTMMRALWDKDEAAARAHCIANGVQVTEVDKDAFRRATEPVLKTYLADPDRNQFYRRIRQEA
ncbi:TRAP transporter substrate-binding protein [Nitrospirillum pindoramense]|uniref:Tripartite ATP-independent transporter DctP family solute receptor n=1 Tax=Nitrospirillum amazonense TaxID=28077 RepID=A0A560HDC0_9PROT|nr:TRAP transporter substrate-binding protein [Nitrospirillum amazonense]TWB44395.1 tripartite ATP-independent transporter DctP family solute receptor [Nitrospirillum amazonense]